MSHFYKKSLAFALLFSLASVVHSQTHALPYSLTLPLPYISLEGCSVFEDYYPNLMKGCKTYEDNIWDAPSKGIIIINQARGTDISEAGERWLILADGSGGPILTSQAWPLRLKRKQLLLGAEFSWTKPVLSFSASSSPAHLIQVPEGESSIKGLQLNGVDYGVNGALVNLDESLKMDISFNIFNTTPIKSTAIDISGEPGPVICDITVIGNNAFNLSASSLGIKVFCLKRANVTTLNNHFNLDGDSKGIHIVTGSLHSGSDEFIQTSPAASRDQSPVAILFDPGSQAEDHRLFYDSRVKCGIFDGGSYGDLVAFSLAGFFEGDSSYPDRITITHNIFRNVSEVVRVAESSPIITADSICNIWEPGDSDDTSRCPTTPPINGFLHFTDGKTCGTRPDNFVEPDCVAERLKVCISPRWTPATSNEGADADIKYY